jgi:uncharacterized protein YbjT (DUF2867 family)
MAAALAPLPGRKRYAPAKPGAGDFAAALGFEASLGIGSPADRADALAGATDLVIVPSFDPAAIECLMRLVQSARDAGVERVHVISLAGADARSPVALLRWIGLVEREASNAGVPRTLLRCGPFMQAIPMFLRRDARGIALVGPFRETAFPWIDAEDAGGILAHIVGRRGTENIGCQLSGPDEASFAAVARLLGQALGEPVAYTDICLPEAQGLLQRSGFPPQRVRAVTEYWDYLVSGVVRPACCEVGRELLGRAPRSLADWCARYAATQLAHA